MIGLYHREISNNNTIYKVHLKRTGSTSSSKRMTANMTQPFLYKVEQIYFLLKFSKVFYDISWTFFFNHLLILENLYDVVFLKHLVWLAQFLLFPFYITYSLVNIEGSAFIYINIIIYYQHFELFCLPCIWLIIS